MEHRIFIVHTRFDEAQSEELIAERARSRTYSTFLRSVFLALIHYAQRDPVFKNMLLSLAIDLSRMRSRRPVAIGDRLESKNIELIVPKDTDSAKRTMYWVMNQSVEIGEIEIIDLLIDWRFAQEAPVPQAIILGLEVGVLPIGLMGKTKIKSVMPIIIGDPAFKMLSPIDIYQSIIKISNTVLSRVYRSSGETLDRLDPALLEWFLDDKKESSFFTGHQEQIELLHEELHRFGIAHATIVDDHTKSTFIAMSPIVHTGTLELFYNLRPLENEDIKDTRYPIIIQ